MINKRKLQSLIYQLFCMFVGLAVISPIIYCVLVSFMQLLPYMLQTGILILFAVLFCWVSAGFWTALMGFLQLLIGRDK